MFQLMSVIAMLIGASIAGLFAVAYIWQIRRLHHEELRSLHQQIVAMRKELDDMKTGVNWPQHS